MIEIDASDFLDVAGDLSAAARADLMDEVRPAVSKGALNIKTGMREDLRGSNRFKGVARTVNYDLKARAGSVEAEIGPTAGKGKGTGALANIAYFGGANGGGGTVRDPEYHLNDESPRLEAAVGSALDKLLRSL